MVRLKRCLCLVLALALLLTWPGFLPQKAEAVAVADDAAVLSLALLFTTWAGVTFNQSDQAVTAMKNFLSTKVSTATSLAGLITKNLVVDGAKLLITGDVRTAFKTVLPEIRDFFKVDTLTDDCSGTLSGSVVVGASYPFITISRDVYNKMSSSQLSAFLKPYCTLPSIPGIEYEISSFSSDGVHKGDIFCISPDSEYSQLDVYNSAHTQFLGTIPFNSTFCLYVVSPSNSNEFVPFGIACLDSSGQINYSFTRGYVFFSHSTCRVVSASDTIDFKQSQTVNGSSVSSSLDSADLDTANASISIAPVTSVVSSGVAGSTAAPGLSAEDYERILADVLAGTAVLPTTPDPTTAEPTETIPEEDKETMVSPDVFNKGLTGVKDALSDGISSVVARIDWAIHYLTDWLSSFWAAVVKAVTVTIPDFLSGIADALTTFFTVTFPAWVTDVKDWAVTLPRTISDAIAVALTAVFIPAAGYWEAKVVALQAAFPLFNAIILSANSLRGFFQGLGSRPPIIYIDLGNSASWAMGGKTIFLDLTWYSQYKPTMDTVLSAFLWIFALWRIFLRLPGLIRGGVGDWGSGTVADEKGSSTDSSTDLTVQR